jgi:hypothetical protein
MANPLQDRKKGLEDEYFHRKEQESLKKVRQRLLKEEQEQNKEMAHLCCPKCGEALEEITFQEIQVDRCTACQGVWLDAGELEHVTARETQGWLSHFWRSSKGH